MAGAYQVSKAGNGYKIGVPDHLGDVLYPLGHYYVATITDEGILFKPLEKLDQGPLPSWVKPGGNTN